MGAHSSLPAITFDDPNIEFLDIASSHQVERLLRLLEAIETIEQYDSFEFSQDPEGLGPPPASKAAIDRLPKLKLPSTPKDSDVCLVCSEQHVIGETVTQLPCGHIFHVDCVSEWLARHCSCPTCRYELPTDDRLYEPGRRNRMKGRKCRQCESMQGELVWFQEMAGEQPVLENGKCSLPRSIRHSLKRRLEQLRASRNRL